MSRPTLTPRWFAFVASVTLCASVRAASGPVVITNQPQNVSTTRCRRVTFSAEVDGTPPYSFQWYRSDGNFQAIPNATNQSYTTPRLSFPDDYAQFRVVITNVAGAVTSAVATVRVLEGPYSPRIIQASRQGVSTRVLLSFADCPLYVVSAQNRTNYTVSGGIDVLSARLVEETNVVLTTSSLIPSSNYTVTVNGLFDTSGHVIQPNSTASFAAWPLSDGFVFGEYYFNISGNYVSDLTNSPAFPDLPDRVTYLSSLELPQNVGGNLGARLSAYLIPPVTGNYNFYIAADSAAKLFLSTDAQPANKVFLCEDPLWSAWRDWTGQGAFAGRHDRRPNQSLGIPLVAGQRYFIEVLMKGSSPYSHCGVAWQLPDAPIPTNGSPPIAGEYLATLVDPALRVNVRASNGVAMISWAAGGMLQQTTNLPPQWVEWPNAPNPLVISNGPTRFFRVRFDP